LVDLLIILVHPLAVLFKSSSCIQQHFFYPRLQSVKTRIPEWWVG